MEPTAQSLIDEMKSLAEKQRLFLQNKDIPLMERWSVLIDENAPSYMMDADDFEEEPFAQWFSDVDVDKDTVIYVSRFDPTCYKEDKLEMLLLFMEWCCQNGCTLIWFKH